MRTGVRALSDMAHKRSRLSACWVPRRQTALVAGGMLYGAGSDQMELYDARRDAWTMCGAKFNFEHKHPLLWMAPSDANNVAMVAGDWIGLGGRKDSLGYVEWVDLRQGDSRKKWNLLSDHTLAQRFGVDGVRANLWESRSLAMLSAGF